MLQFQNIIASVDPPPPPETDITFEVIGRGYTPIDDDMDDRYNVPTLEELGEILINFYLKNEKVNWNRQFDFEIFE